MSNVAPCIGINDGPVAGAAPRVCRYAGAVNVHRIVFVPRTAT